MTKVIGLTGGIASGKSTVCQILRTLGAQIIDADEVSREVVSPGQPALAEIDARFPGVLKPDGSLNRARLAERIFSDEAERAALNAIIHPRIGARVQARIGELREAGAKLVIYDAPLLIENNLHQGVEGVILVAAPPELQISRLVARNGFTREQAEARLRSQLPLEAKRKYASWVIDNSGDLTQLRAQVEAVWREIAA